MASEWTLPLLQEALDDLSAWAEFRLPQGSMIELFGINDVATRRIARFARGHSCDILFGPNGVTFRKLAK